MPSCVAVLQLNRRRMEDGHIAFNSLNLVPNPTGNAIPVIKRRELNKEIVFSTTAQATVEGIEGKQTIREIDEKYVSFGSIEEIETAEAADSAREPFRE